MPFLHILSNTRDLYFLYRFGNLKGRKWTVITIFTFLSVPVKLNNFLQDYWPSSFPLPSSSCSYISFDHFSYLLLVFMSLLNHNSSGGSLSGTCI